MLSCKARFIYGLLILSSVKRAYKAGTGFKGFKGRYALKTFVKIMVLLALTAAAVPTSAQWIQSGLDSSEVPQITSFGSYIFALRDLGYPAPAIFRSADSGKTWAEDVNGLDSQTLRYLNCLSSNASTMYAGCNNAGVWATTNNGSSWTSRNSGLTSLNVSSLLASGDTIYAGTSDSGVYRSTNGGASWTISNQGLQINGYFPLPYAFCKINNMLLLGCELLNTVTLKGMYYSQNAGASWTFVGADSDCSNFATMGDTIFGATPFGLWRYYTGSDVGNPADWTEFRTPAVPDTYITAITITKGTIFIGTRNKGVYFSADRGNTWNAFNTGLPGYNIWSLLAVDGYLFAGVCPEYSSGTPFACYGLWRRPLLDAGIVPSPPKAEEKVSRLHFSGSSNILSYILQSASFVDLSLYTPSGKKFAVLDRGMRQPGERKIGLGRYGLPAGLYVCRLGAGSYQECRAFIEAE